MLTVSLRAKITEVANRLKVPEAWLSDVIWLESNYSSTVVNSIGATGLIQFTKTTAHDLGTTTEKLKAMAPEVQMEYVYSYLVRAMAKRTKPANFFDFYTLVFYPVWVGKPLTAVLPASAYAGNSGIDLNRDGVVTKFEFSEAINKRLKKKSLLMVADDVKNTAISAATGATNAVKQGIQAIVKQPDNIPLKIAAVAAGIITFFLLARRLVRRRAK